ncbi:MAG TPA: hypothetical protein VEM40_08460 [Nitrospirota bacterium]|nr:hypothetical protein [Nitrospirota bacterium]
MHTDEFEISLSRELSVCRNTIKRIKHSLSVLERRHNKTTGMFMDELRSNRTSNDPACKDDCEAWRSSYESLKRWEELEQQYQEALRVMKI